MPKYGVAKPIYQAVTLKKAQNPINCHHINHYSRKTASGCFT
ncbi:hypothetical protein AO382_0809 [Moraxella catarrhalis]|uniref:Uncharacterized protein n=1 Tax=Moraxella catarrhalis TaxID=480 RepID=A0A7Z0UZ36_MORCA|nr:hypothetical protein AO382_0809 [Moraxella catarrhalis]